MTDPFEQARAEGPRTTATFVVDWGWTMRDRAYRTLFWLASAHHVQLSLQERRRWFSSTCAGNVAGWTLDVRAFSADLRRMQEGSVLFVGEGPWWHA